jgi:hypothetical protein
MSLHKAATRSPRGFFALLIPMFLLLLTACGGGAGTSSPPSQTITSVSPAANSDNLLVTTTVSVVFGIDMDASSVESAFTVRYLGGNVAGSVIYDAPTRTAVFTPTDDLVSDGLYTATVSSAVRDAGGGMPLSSDYVWSFSIAPSTVSVSTDANGALGDNASFGSDIDSQGRYVVFVSRATDLTSVPSGGIDQVYRKDTLTGEIEMASTDASGLVAANGTPAGTPSAAISGDGRYVVFDSNATNLQAISSGGIFQVYRKDMQTGTIEMISRARFTAAGNDVSRLPAISADGNYVVFQSLATNLDGGANGISDIFLFDVQSASIERVSVDTTGGIANGDSVTPDVSDDGRYVVFQSLARNLGSCTTGQGDIFVRDRQASVTTCVSVDSTGANANAPSSDPVISGDGSTAVFTSTATNLVAQNTGGIANIFARDFTASIPATTLVSISQSGTVSDSACNLGSVSSNGHYVSFVSSATNLVAGDGNGVDDIFVRDTLIPNATFRVSVTAAGAEANNDSGGARISDNGRYVSFSSTATNLDASDTTNVASDVFRAHNAAY